MEKNIESLDLSECDLADSESESTIKESSSKKVKQNLLNEENTIVKCNGYDANIKKLYLNFPFQVFDDESEWLCQLSKRIVFENGVFHSVDCYKNKYLLIDKQSKLRINDECDKLKTNKRLASLISVSESSKKQTNHKYLSYNQLKSTIDKNLDDINNLKLQSLNLKRENLSLRNRNDDLKRLINLIANNELARVNVIIKTCLKQKVGVNGIIERLNDAIARVYSCKSYSEVEFDAGVLVLRIGGPRLIYALNKLGLLPSRSVITNSLRLNISSIYFSLNSCVEDIIKHNMELVLSNNDNNEAKPSFYSLKMDEIVIDERVRWNPKNNEIIGTCWQHKNEVISYSFNSWLNLKEIKQALDKGAIHTCKEALVVTLCKLNTENIITRPILVVPLCCKSNADFIVLMIKIIADEFECYPNCKLINVASDGDSSRRKALNSLRHTNIHLNALTDLQFFSQKLLFGRYSVNYDPKHLVKRFRGIFISDKREIQLIDRVINKDLIKFYYKGKKNLDEMLDPRDRQNVPMAVSMLTMLCNTPVDLSDSLTGLDKSLLLEFQLLAIISKLLLSFFTVTSININDQLFSLAKLAFYVFFIYRKNQTKFLSNDLYSDIQSTIQDAFLAVAHYQHECSPDKLLLILLGIALIFCF